MEPAGEDLLEGEGEGVDRSSGGEEAEVEGGVDLEVLDVEPGGGVGEEGGEEGGGGGEEGGFDGDDDVGLRCGLAQDYWSAEKGEGGEVEEALEAGGVAGT